MKQYKKMITTILLGGVLLGSLAGCGSSNTATAESTILTEASSKTTTTESTGGVLVMGTNATFPPFEYVDQNEIVGFDVEMAELIANELGMELKVQDMEFEAIFGALPNDMIDIGMAGITVNEERLTQVDFSDGYFDTKQMVIVKKDSGIVSSDDLVGKKVGAQLGTTSATFAKLYIEDVKVIEFNKSALAVADLMNGTVDAVIVDAAPAQSLIKGQDSLMILETPFAEEEYAIAIKKGNSELTGKINEALATIKENGQYDELYSKYFSETDK
ncbi:hypothetical protein AN639_04335 [Candidatus Epulonipiscium fishelsonii]|uniref:Uncharacterized protein n=1 Tax=Candidatus Epulonipiscium fishelsonii TaxID=77094 RepID=A0ACC8XCH6_9FIRM|nr:hypothetical protein AN396_06370 [Epulopiscium sp. SCG-B11WGA-EpuloA1]ONI40765.1 hypothetical protein AN639_04335 [Epulopiscium sp. SCG-B05WGA-EpuloA1]